jgi:hypothetical protein
MSEATTGTKGKPVSLDGGGSHPPQSHPPHHHVGSHPPHHGGYHGGSHPPQYDTPLLKGARPVIISEDGTPLSSSLTPHSMSASMWTPMSTGKNFADFFFQVFFSESKVI